MAQQEDEPLFRGTLFEKTYEAAVRNTPKRHSAWTEQCPSFFRFKEARGEHFTAEEQRHIQSCRRCTSLLASFWRHGGCPSRVLVMSAPDWAKAALEKHLEGQECRWCRMVRGLAALVTPFRLPAMEGAFAPVAPAGLAERLFLEFREAGLDAVLQETSDQRIEVFVQTGDRSLEGREVRIEVRGEGVGWSETERLEKVEPIGCVARHDFGAAEEMLPARATDCVFSVSLLEDTDMVSHPLL
jgi:hypothetical protein